jgi:hypothetical protein
LAVAHSGDHAQAAAAAGELAGGPRVPGAILYDLACAFALCTAAARQDVKLPEAERTKVAETYAGRAVELLMRAQESGLFKDPAQVANVQIDPDLDALRPRNDFKKFLDSLGAKEMPDER